MAKAAGRREDETSSPASQRHGPESWALGFFVGLIVLGVIALLAFAGMG